MITTATFSNIPVVPKFVETNRPLVLDCAPCIESLVGVIPADEYWRWNGMWSHSLRTAVFGAVFIEYLHSGSLLSQQGVAETLGSESVLVLTINSSD